MELNVWLAYVITEIIVDLSPGPAVLLITSLGMKFGAKSSYFGAFGISLSNITYFILSALGLGTLIFSAGDLFEYIKWAGAAYLIFTGISMLYHSVKVKESILFDTLNTQKNTTSFLQGFITQGTNPKAILFFVALLPQFIDSSENIMLQFIILGLTTIVVETSILMLYGYIASKGRDKLANNKVFKKWQDRVAGSLLVGIGIHLFFLKKN